MIYRDDETTIFRSELANLKKRLDKFERLYENEGIKQRKSLLATFFKGLWHGVTWPFVRFWWYKTPISVALLICGLVAGLVLIVAKSDESRREDEQQVEQALNEQCSSFCGTHGYQFHDNRQENMCLCTSDDPEETTFIIDVDTSEHWIVTPNNTE